MGVSAALCAQEPALASAVRLFLTYEPEPTAEMLQSAVHSAGMSELLDAVLSVDSVRQFKTTPTSYQIVTDHFGFAPADVLFVSSNAWDALGATWFGFTTLWVNRQGLPPEAIGPAPHHTGRDLTAVLQVLG